MPRSYDYQKLFRTTKNERKGVEKTKDTKVENEEQDEKPDRTRKVDLLKIQQLNNTYVLLCMTNI